MLRYISLKDYNEEISDIEDLYLIQILKDTACKFLTSGGKKRVYLSTLEYKILKKLEREEGTIDELLNNPDSFWNLYTTFNMYQFLQDFDEEIKLFIDICSSMEYCPDLPTYEDLDKGINGLVEYMFLDVMPCIYRFLLQD